MKYIEFDDSEQKILKDYEAGKLKRIPRGKTAKAQYQSYARQALAKTKNINIRISEQDLLKIKSLAVRKGIPYQTVITSVIHQYSTGQLKEG